MDEKKETVREEEEDWDAEARNGFESFSSPLPWRALTFSFSPSPPASSSPHRMVFTQEDLTPQVSKRKELICGYERNLSALPNVFILWGGDRMQMCGHVRSRVFLSFLSDLNGNASFFREEDGRRGGRRQKQQVKRERRREGKRRRTKFLFRQSRIRP